MSRYDLSGEVAVVIGGTGVLGGAIAQGLAEAGAKVAVLGRSLERGKERVAAIEQAGGEALFAAGDATDKTSLVEAQAAVGAGLGTGGVVELPVPPGRKNICLEKKH